MKYKVPMTGQKLCKSCGVVKEVESFYMQSGGVYRQPKCKECHKKHTVSKRQENKEQSRDYARKLYAKNREKELKRGAEYRDKNREKVRKSCAASNVKHREKRRVQKAIWHARTYETRKSVSVAWQQANHDKTAAMAAKRRAAKLRATPTWANAFFVKEAYHIAKLRTKATGIRWHVDHIVPLKSKIVCGLHVEHNLQVIPEKENLRKSNAVWPDMPT